MSKFSKVSLFILRVVTGWLMFYAGITKILNPDWSAAGYLQNAGTFPELYAWFLQPNVLPFINFANEWALTLLGISLILGVFVRLSSILGIALMLLYYFPVLHFPHVDPYYFIVDDHLVNSAVLLVLAATQAGRIWGIDAKLRFLRNKPVLGKVLG